jgi:chromosome segregation ATPase
MNSAAIDSKRPISEVQLKFELDQVKGRLAETTAELAAVKEELATVRSLSGGLDDTIRNLEQKLEKKNNELRISDIGMTGLIEQIKHLQRSSRGWRDQFVESVNQNKVLQAKLDATFDVRVKKFFCPKEEKKDGVTIVRIRRRGFGAWLRRLVVKFRR